MLKKLRLKFVIINMVIVTMMLTLIFSLLYISTAKSLEEESLQMMKSVTMNPMQFNLPFNPDGEKKDIRLPYFVIRYNTDGEIETTDGNFFDISDDDLINEISQKAYNSNEEVGEIEEYDLRFMTTKTPMGKTIVFSDISSEQSTLNHLLRTFVIIGILAFLLFLEISYLLSKWAVKPVEKAWNQQKQFVADASHELKTPLTVIMTDAELLNAPDCSEEDRLNLSGSIITMSAQMRSLTENLLELARIDNGSVKETMTNVHFSELVTNSAMIFEPVFFEKDMPFTYDVEPDITVNGIEAHLKQVTDILLENASKYASPKGKIKMTLKKTSSKKCLLEVSNEGEPIAEEDLKNLFKRFYRADKSRTGNQSHSFGLGLSIAENIAKEHGGNIRAESKNGFNSFYVEISI